MIALAVEFCLVVAWFIWLYRRQVRDRERQRRVPLRQLRLPLEKDGEVGS
jgi:hypothetical protein